jgi:iron-sulfur cluster assembly accessory protein
MFFPIIYMFGQSVLLLLTHTHIYQNMIRRFCSLSTRRRPLFRPPPPVTLTENAVRRVKELLEQQPTSTDVIGVRLGVRSRGCNGLSYTLHYATTKEATDEEVLQDDVRVLIEPKALFYIIGTTMDYEDTVVVSEFTFTNPNANGTCGCGESFTL